jgi:hypothetical protein
MYKIGKDVLKTNNVYDLYKEKQTIEKEFTKIKNHLFSIFVDRKDMWMAGVTFRISKDFTRITIESREKSVINKVKERAQKFGFDFKETVDKEQHVSVFIPSKMVLPLLKGLEVVG